MKTKKPFIVVLGITSLLLLSVYRYFEYKAQLSDDFEQFQLYREEKMLSYSEIGKQLILDEKLTQLKNLLEAARKARDIDFYILQYQGSPLLLGAYGDHPEAIDIEYKVMDQFMRGPDVSAFSTKVDTETVFTVGINRSFADHFALRLSQEKVSELQIILGPVILFLLLAAYFFKDIQNILRTLRTKGSHHLAAQNSKSLEAEILTGALTGYQARQQSLETKARILENQVLPSLKTEISSGLTPPYSFNCTLVRTDINNFSFIFNNFDAEKLMTVINEFFTVVSHIVARYDGLIHEFVGDEVIFYIKDQNSSDSTLKALSALRDINQAAAQFNEYTQHHLGFPFTVKSSLARGRLRFGHLVNGFTLAGALLIETVRVLSQIQEKEENIIGFNEKYADGLAPICEVAPYSQMQLKGYSDTMSVVRYVQHLPLSRLLQNLSPKNLASLTYYRSDEDIRQILRKLKQDSRVMEPTSVLQILEILRKFPRTFYHSAINEKNDVDLGAELMQLIQTLLSEPRPHLPDSALRDEGISLPAAACHLAKTLMTAADFESYYASHFSQWLQRSDPRLIASIIELLIHFRHEKSQRLIRSFLLHQDSNVAAIALVYEGYRGLNPELLDHIRASLTSKDRDLVTQTQSAIRRIAQYHQETDPVYYNSQIEFLNLLETLPPFDEKKGA